MAKILLPIILFLVCSCAPIPHTSIVAPELSIKVLDEETNKPVEDVTIIYHRGDYEKRYFFKKGNKALVGPLKQWHYLLYIGSPGHAPFPDRLNYINIVPLLFTISAPGYKSNKFQSKLEPWYKEIDCYKKPIPWKDEEECSKQLINPQEKNIEIIDIIQNSIEFKLKKS